MIRHHLYHSGYFYKSKEKGTRPNHFIRFDGLTEHYFGGPFERIISDMYYLDGYDFQSYIKQPTYSTNVVDKFLINQNIKQTYKEDII